MIWYDARIRDSKLWAADWTAGTKVLVTRVNWGLAVGPIWFIFDGKHLRSVADALHAQAFVVKKPHSDQDLCRHKARPFLRRFEAMRVSSPVEPRNSRPEAKK